MPASWGSSFRISLLLLSTYAIMPSAATAIGDFTVSATPNTLWVQRGDVARSQIVIISGVVVPFSCADYKVIVTSSPPGLPLTLSGSHFCIDTNGQADATVGINGSHSSDPAGTYTINLTVGLCMSSACTSFSLSHTITLIVTFTALYDPPGWWSDWASLGHPPNVMISSSVVAQNQDGRLEAFSGGSDGNLWHIWQAAPNNVWSSWSSLGTPAGVTVSSPAVAQNGHLEVFVVSNDGNLWHIWQAAPNNVWSSWANLGGNGVLKADPPAVVLNQDGQLELFVRNTSDRAQHIRQGGPNDGWSVWDSLGGLPINSVAAASSSYGRLIALGLGADNRVWYDIQTVPNGAWGDWSSLGGTLTKGLVADRNVDGRLEAFALGNDNALWHSWQRSTATITSVSELPPSWVFQPSPPGSGDKWQYLAIPGAHAEVVNGSTAEIIELRGWLRYVPNSCYGDDPDWHYDLELDPDWLDQLGLKITDIITPGNILLKTPTTPAPQTWRNMVVVPLVHVELNGWKPSNQGDVVSPATDWGFRSADPANCSGVSWAFNPVNPLPTQTPLVQGQYVRMVGSLLTDEPHAGSAQGATFFCRIFGICASSAIEQNAVKNELMGNYSAGDPHNPMRWTEIHPPDVIASLETRAQTNSVRAVLLDATAECFFGPCETQTADFDIPAPGLASSSCAGLQCQEMIIGTVTDLSTIVNGNRDLTGAAITNFSDHFHIHVTTQGPSLYGGQGKFGAIYRVYWQNLRCMSAVVAIVQKSRTTTTIRVIAKDSLSSEPLAGATVKVFDDLSDDVRASGITAADGSVTITYSRICIDPETKKPITCSLVALATITGYGDRTLKVP